MREEPIKMLRLGYCQYSDLKEKLGRSLSEMIERFSEQKKVGVVSCKLNLDLLPISKERIKRLDLEFIPPYLERNMDKVYQKVEELNQTHSEITSISYNIELTGEY